MQNSYLHQNREDTETIHSPYPDLQDNCDHQGEELYASLKYAAVLHS